MLDFKKITFNEFDDDETPIQFFFNYDLSQDEIDTFLANYTSEDDLDESKNVIGIELCLSMYSASDFKLEAICSYDDGCTKDWVELWNAVTQADAFIEIIKTANTENSNRAYALYQAAI